MFGPETNAASKSVPSGNSCKNKNRIPYARNPLRTGIPPAPGLVRIEDRGIWLLQGRHQARQEEMKELI